MKIEALRHSWTKKDAIYYTYYYTRCPAISITINIFTETAMDNNKCKVKRCRDQRCLVWLGNPLCDRHWRQIAQSEIEQEKEELIERWGLKVTCSIDEFGLVCRAPFLKK